MKNNKAIESKAVGATGGECDATLAPGKFVTIQALARRWSVSDNTVKRLIEEGELKGIKVRKSYKIFLGSVVEYETRSSF